jgi:6,7-dimethyl-8-ribityllumazine synthase
VVEAGSITAQDNTAVLIAPPGSRRKSSRKSSQKVVLVRENTMPHVVEGHLRGEGRRVAIVVSRFNSFITARLLDGALDGLKRHGVADDDVTVMYVPGAVEIPLAARRLAESGKHHAVVCLGAVIRGATPHFDYVCAETTRGIGRVSQETGVPTILGVLTTDSVEQAVERAGTKSGNKGFDAAQSALEMISLLEQL